MLIEIKGVQFVNKGAELMLCAILDKVNEYWPDAEICMVQDANTLQKDRQRIGAFRKVNCVKNRFDFNGLTYWLPKPLRQYIQRKYALVMEADVDIVLDASGFLYSEQWNYLPLKQTSLVAKRFAKKKKHFILMPQALGPFQQDKYKAAASELFQFASLVFARDNISFKQATSLCEQHHVQLAPDFTNLYQPAVNKEYEHLKGKVAFILNSKMISSQNNNVAWRENYQKVITQLVNTAKALGQEVFFLNHEGPDDLALCQTINTQLAQPLEIISPKSCADIKAIIGQCRWVMSSRFHGCVSALSQNIPCLATSWSHKYEMLFEDYGHAEWLVDIALDEQGLTSYLTQFINEYDANVDSLASNVSELKDLSEQMWAQVVSQINTK